MTEPDDDIFALKPENRAHMVESFRAATRAPAFQRIIQRGRGREQAEFFMELDDGTVIALGAIDRVWSQTELRKTLFVTTGIVPIPVENAKWPKLITQTLMAVTDVEEPSAAESTREWVRTYLGRRGRTDRDHAATATEPFAEKGWQYIYPEHFARYVRAEIGEKQVKNRDVKALLEDIGFATVQVNYYRDGRREPDQRTQARYYRRRLNRAESAESAESPC